MTDAFDDAVARACQLMREAAADQVAEEQHRLLAAALHEIGHLEIALEHRTVIGQATGIVMERYGLNPHNAMGALRRLSQESNRKLHDIAIDLIDTSMLDLLKTSTVRAEAETDLTEADDAG